MSYSWRYDSEHVDANRKGAGMMDARGEVAYEYWCDGECVKVFERKDKALVYYKGACRRQPNSLHTIFKVMPCRKSIVQWVP